MYRLCAFNTTFCNILRYFVAVSFIGGDIHLVVIGNQTNNDCVGRFKSTYQRTAASAIPPKTIVHTYLYAPHTMIWGIVIL
jgi:hypothetical protein